MGKHPGDLIGRLTSLEELDGLLEDIIDKHPATPTSNKEQDIIQLIIISKRCVQASPEDAPTMQQVYRTLTGAYQHPFACVDTPQFTVLNHCLSGFQFQQQRTETFTE